MFWGLLWLEDPRKPGRALWWVSAMQGLPSSAQLGFRLRLGKLSEVVVVLLPNGLSSWSHSRASSGRRGVSDCHQFLGGPFIFIQTCSVYWKLTLRKTRKAAHKNTGCTDRGQMPTHRQALCCLKAVCRDGDIFRECQDRKSHSINPASPTLTERG